MSRSRAADRGGRAGPGRRRHPRAGRGRRTDRHAGAGRSAHARLLGRATARRRADPHCLARGVTTAVDAGSAGAATFPGLPPLHDRRLGDPHPRDAAHLHDRHGARRRQPPRRSANWKTSAGRASTGRSTIAREHADSSSASRCASASEWSAPTPSSAARRCAAPARPPRRSASRRWSMGGTSVPLEETPRHARSRRCRDPLLPRPHRGRPRRATARCARRSGGRVERGIRFDVGHGAGSFDFAGRAPGAGAGPPAGDDQLGHPRLEYRRAGLRPGHDRQQVPPPGPATGRGDPPGHRPIPRGRSAGATGSGRWRRVPRPTSACCGWPRASGPSGTPPDGSRSASSAWSRSRCSAPDAFIRASPPSTRRCRISH